MCSLYPISERTCAHVVVVVVGGGGGGHGLIKCADEKNSMPFVSEKQSYEYIISWLPVKEWVGGEKAGSGV